VPGVYDAELSAQEAIDAVVRSANRTLLLVSGGEKAGDEAMLEKSRESHGGGCHRADLRPERVAARA
jgi:class I fructose-bisphosphate aldolase